MQLRPQRGNNGGCSTGGDRGPPSVGVDSDLVRSRPSSGINYSCPLQLLVAT